MLAAAVESGTFDTGLAHDANGVELRELLERAESGESEPDPGLEATVRAVRSPLDENGE